MDKNQKINYQLKLEEILKEEAGKKRVPKLLLHSCCAPCSTYVLEYLTPYFDISVLYYNPNIHPSEEFFKREKEQERFINMVDKVNKIDLIKANYNPQEFFSLIKGHELDREGGNRCGICFELRLAEAAKYAKDLGYDYFTTTLSISPHKNAQVINQIGERLEEKYHVRYLYADFKKKNGFKRSIELCNQFDIYRQEYCGCVFSLKQSIEDRKKKEMETEDLEKLYSSAMKNTKRVEKINLDGTTSASLHNEEDEQFFDNENIKVLEDKISSTINVGKDEYSQEEKIDATASASLNIE